MADLRIFLNIVVTFLFSMSSSLSANEYIFSYAKDGYSYSIINLRFEGSSVQGGISPLLGVSGSTFNVAGENYAQGKLRLVVFDGDTPVFQGEFRKEINGGKISWVSTTKPGVEFYRWRGRQLSEATKTVYQHSCGALYGALEAYGDDLTVSKLTDAIPGLDAMSVQLRDGSYAEISVPIGTEAYVVQRLREVDEVSHANLWGGGCGGGEVSYFTIPKKLISASQGELDGQKFARFIRNSVGAFLDRTPEHKGYSNKIQQREVRRSVLPPFPLQNRVSIVAASSASREYGNSWDRFDLFFTTADLPGLSDEEVAIVLWAEKLFTGNARVRDGVEPPRREFIDVELNYDDEATVAVLFASFVSSQVGGRCEVDSEGIFESFYDDQGRYEYLWHLCKG
ncbi:hypothetical protein AIOL_000642 [Candidatus Rhodobacter oscarellae]|uniref:Uncharacterized protein n=1 Tax=Candidatus Rhodobacter oscarellae TaxID=1675527 RepID=A0A0J9ECT5_9RHOB|nr:hypothetical protein [Candidatus Rhodobacter lobularis]KMW60486.1 hypothetical protein AIOL_000642 [Candidatus Rhodobacter lobularis]